MKKRQIFTLFLALLLAAGLMVPAGAAEAGAEAEAYTPPPDPAIQSKGALLMDLNEGVQLYEKDADLSLYPASLTKIMTCLLVLEAIDREELTMDTEITASEVVTTLPADSSTAGIKPGEVLTVRQLLYCLMVSSANESADILAEAVAGSVPAFVEAMNARAQELGCKHTHFVNPHGFHDDNHYTCCRDVYLMTLEALKHPAFVTLCDTTTYVVPATNLAKERTLRTTNLLLDQWRVRGYLNPEAHGVKTGSTSQAGYCLVSTAQRGERRLLSVIMGAEIVKNADGTTNRMSFSETTRLFNWGFENFRYQTTLEAGTAVAERSVDLSRTENVVALSEQDATALTPAGLRPEMLERNVVWSDEALEAPVEEGQKLGTVTLEYQGVPYGSADLVAATGAERSKVLAFQRAVVNAATDIRYQIGAAALAVLVAAGVVFRLRNRKNRYGGGTGTTPQNGYKGR